jgi:catechol 2,3-dioxygenase-like lactoylglutathione lyase family enzyme
MAGPIVDRLDLVFYWVSDLGRSVEFYEGILGLRLLRRDAGNWAEFDAGGRRFALHSAAEGQPVTPGGATAVFSVEDLDRAKAELAGLGIEFGHEGDVAGYARFASFSDPDGNPIQLIEYEASQAESAPHGA